MAVSEQLSPAVLLVLIRSIILILLQSLYVCGNDCEVHINVSLPLEEKIFIPQGSTVWVNCTAGDITDEADLVWSITLPDRRQVDYRFSTAAQKKILNDRGFHDLPAIDAPVEIIQMVINNTDDINGTDGTVLECANTLTGQLLLRITLFVHEPTLIKTIQVRGIAEHSVNLTWTSPETLEQIEQGVRLNYSLNVVKKSGTSSCSHSFQLWESYVFTAPEGAQPCDVYNFSVTTNYDVVGAKYTGAGCSVPSPVLSMMLPSLPDISSLESSLQYSLQKESDGGITMRITFMPANYCEMYPATGYALEVEGPISHSDISQPPSNGALSVNNLLDNEAYSFKVVVSNSVGNVSTGYITIYTTDVQTIRALPQEDNKSFILQCNFMAGSNAQGCMVVVVGEFENITGNVTRDSKCASHTVILNTTYPTSNYSAVFGYDIEYDGSIGDLVIPGVIVRDPASIPPCVPEELKPRPSQNIPTWAIITIGVILGVALVSITVILVFFVAYRLVRRYRTEKHSSYYHVSRPSPTSSAGPAPVTPPPAPAQDFIDEEDDTKKPQPIYDQPEKIAIPKEEHTYHVLETSTPRYQFKREDFCKPGNGLISPPAHDAQSPTHSESDSSCDPPPVYQDIADLPLVRDRDSSGRAGASGQETCSPSTQLNSSPSQPPVYQEITELPSSRASFGLHDSVP